MSKELNADQVNRAIALVIMLLLTALALTVLIPVAALEVGIFGLLLGNWFGRNFFRPPPSAQSPLAAPDAPAEIHTPEGHDGGIGLAELARPFLGKWALIRKDQWLLQGYPITIRWGRRTGAAFVLKVGGCTYEYEELEEAKQAGERHAARIACLRKERKMPAGIDPNHIAILRGLMHYSDYAPVEAVHRAAFGCATTPSFEGCGRRLVTLLRKGWVAKRVCDRQTKWAITDVGRLAAEQPHRAGEPQA